MPFPGKRVDTRIYLYAEGAAGQCLDQAGGEFAQLLRIHQGQLIVHLHAFDTATAQRTATDFSGDANRCLCADATPWQPDHQRLQLFHRYRQ